MNINLVNLPPLKTKFLDDTGNMHKHWQDYFSGLSQFLTENYSNAGINIPTLTQNQINKIQPKALPSIVHNSTTKKLMVKNDTTFVNVTTA